MSRKKFLWTWKRTTRRSDRSISLIPETVVFCVSLAGENFPDWCLHVLFFVCYNVCWATLGSPWPVATPTESAKAVLRLSKSQTRVPGELGNCQLWGAVSNGF